MNPTAKDILMHYGVARRSGRYPWGSGENPHQRTGDFLSRVDEYKSKGMGDTEIAKAMGLTTTQYRVQKALAREQRRAIDVATAKDLRAKGYSLNEIAEKMGFNNDSSVRSLLNADSEARMNETKVAYEFIKKQVDERGMIDVGVGAERELGISREKMKQALYMMELEGYELYGGGVPQVGNPGKQTNIQVICPPGTQHKEIYNYENINSLKDYRIRQDADGNDVVTPAFVYPASMDSKRLSIRYAEDGGVNMDGVIELRRGVPDLSLGESRYAQVRILVDGDRYLKGMAMYADDLPDGVDVRFNTNKSKSKPMRDVLKEISNDPDNPFGSLIKEDGGQSYYTDKDGKQKLSLINKRADEGDWGEWSDKLPSQFLSKQHQYLIDRQLNIAIKDKQAEYDEINSLTNPTVKKALLKSFADDCDSTAVHLQAAALPRQKYQVILPITDMKDDEVYAPNYKNGEQVALIRYPHGGTFEIPILTVNNKHASAKKKLGNAEDAVGINSKVAERLSGADFDGDTVMVIPTGGKIKIKSTPKLRDLEGFDNKLEYPYKEGMKVMGKQLTQTEMGKVSNLITDMTLKGATESELAKAVKHSMVVIDANKHKLNYKQSEIDNDIATLKKKYQGHYDENGKYHEGASTLISKAKSETTVLKRQGQPKINIKGTADYDPSRPEGALLYKTVSDSKLTYTDPKTGKTKTRTQASTKMAETDDAFTLVSDFNTKAELSYANYANTMKAMANQARKDMVGAGKIPYSASAKETYRAEVDSLEAKLNVALKNAPRERQAQTIANAVVKAKKQDNPELTKEQEKKIASQALQSARNKVGAKKESIVITDKEWEAIQAGAITENKLTQILNNTKIEDLKERATPRSSTTLSAAKQAKIATMQASGNYSTAEIAAAVGVSSSTVLKYMN